MNYVPGSSVIPFDETSRVSRVTATIGRTADNSVSQISSSVFNDFFLMFDELGRCLPPNSIFVFIQIFISFFQYYISIFLPFLKEKWDFNKYPDKILRYLAYPVDFGLGDTNILESGIPSYFLLIFDFIIVLYLFLIIIYHRIYKMFPKYNVYVIRFILSFLIPIILPPSFFNIGFSFNKSFKVDNYIDLDETNSTMINETIVIDITEPFNQKHRSLFIASTFFGILLSLTLLTVFFIDMMFRASTPYIENTPLSMWDGKPFFLCIFGCCIMNVSSRFIDRLPSWTDYVLIVCCVFYNLFILYEMFYFPMIKQWMNKLISILVSSGIIISIFQLLPIQSLYRLIIPFATFFIFIPVFILSFRFLMEKIVKQDLNEVKIKNENEALRYLRLSIAYNYEDFISFKWLKSMNHFDTPKIISQVSQIISFFPSESQNLTFYISILTKNHRLNFYQRFLLFQIRQVHILRQSNTSKQLNEDLAEISKVTNRSINSFSQFLIRIIDERQQLSLDGLNFLAKINRETSSICHEALARYPNNARLLFIFSRYVIECCADFKTGISLFHEGQLIDRGKRTTIDVAFQSMVNLFPNYLWKRILNYKGQIIYRRKHSKSGSSMSADSTTNERPNRISDFDIESNEKIASNVIENPKLRCSLRKAVNNMNSVGIPILTANAIIRFLLAVIMCITLMFVAPDFLSKRSINYNSIAQINMFRKNLDLCLFRTAKYWSYNLGLAPKQENITDILGPSVSLNDYHNLTISPSDELFRNVVESVKSNEKLGQLLIEVNYKQSANLVGQSNDEIGKFKTGLLHVKNISFCNKKMHKVFEASTSLRYFSLYILNQVSSVTTLNKEYEKPSDWKHDECVCEIILNMNNIVSVLNEQSDVLVSREKIYSDSVDKNLKIVMSIFVPVVFIIFIIPLIAGFFKLQLEFQHIFDVLSLLPIKIYKDASKPIAIFQSDIEQTTEAVTQIDHKGCQKLAIILPVIISTIIITVGLAGVLLLFLDVNKQFYTLVKWLEIGSLRAPLVIEIVTHCIFAGIYGYLGSTNYTSHEYHLNMMVNYSKQLLLKHKSLIYGSNELKPCNAFNNELDDLQFTNTCKLNVNGDTFRENYRCLSLDQQVYSLHKLTNDVNIAMWNAQKIVEGSDDKQEYNQAFRSILNDYESINLHFLGISYLLPKLEKAQNILNDGIFLQVDHLKQYTYLITLFVIAASVIIFIIELFVMNNLKEELSIVRILIARLPPISVIKNKQLVELIVGRKNKKLNKLTPISINVQNCSNSVIIFNRNFRIQMVNSSTSKLFGFTKEQLYQSDLSMIISKEDCDIIKDICNKNFKQKENQNQSRNAEMSELENETNEEILSSLLHKYDNDDINLNNNNTNNYTNEQINLSKNPFTKTIIGVKDDSTQAILSSILTYLPEPDDVFALILTDETLLYVNEEDIKQAKQRVNEILNQVLPFDIIQNYNMKENISFSVKQLCVITIKILNFNDMLPHITSVQAVRNMSELFLTYDNQLLNYQTLTKTCVISNSYQAVGGLFNSSAFKNINTSATEYFDSECNTENEKNNNETIVEEEEDDDESIIIPNNAPDSSDDESEYQKTSNLNNEGIITNTSRISINDSINESENYQQLRLDDADNISRASSESVKLNNSTSSVINFNESENQQTSKLNNNDDDSASKTSNKSINLNNNEQVKRQPPKLNNADSPSKSSNKSINISNSGSLKRQPSKLNNKDNASKSSSKSVNLDNNMSLKHQPSKLNNADSPSKSSSKSVNLDNNMSLKRQSSKLNNADSPSKSSSKSVNLDNNSGSVKRQSSRFNKADNASKSSNKSANLKNSKSVRRQSLTISSKDSISKANSKSINFNSSTNNIINFSESENEQSLKLNNNNDNSASKTSNKSININNNEQVKRQPSKLNNTDNISRASSKSINFNSSTNNIINFSESENEQPLKLNSDDDNISKASSKSITFTNSINNVNNFNESENEQLLELKASNLNIDLNNNNNNNNNEPEMQQASKLNNEDNISRASSKSINLNNNNNNNNNDDDEPEKQQTSKLSDKNDVSKSSKKSVVFSNTNIDYRIQGIMSIYDSNLLSQNKPEAFHNIILDSIYFAFNCLDATEYINSAFGTNFVIGIGINVGSPCTAGTLGDEHMQFSVVGEAVKTSYCVCNAAEAGNIIISKDVFEHLKESSEAQKNFVFEKYKEINLPHSKKCKTYLTKLSDVFKQEAQLEESEGGNEDIHHQESLMELENLTLSEQQIRPPDE